MQSHCYRETLKRHLAERMDGNPRYSLRAFSRDLAISPSRLSEILNGKQGLSEKWARKIAGSLQMTENEAQEFCDRVLASDGRAKKVRAAARDLLAARATQTELQALQLDTFKTISDWYHFAILELTKVKGANTSPRWVAGKLGISELEAQMALDRLVRLGLLVEKDGRWKLTNKSLTTPHGIPSEAIRKFNRQILDKGREAIASQTVEERDISTLTLAVRKEDFPRVQELIKKFRRELNAELEAAVPEGTADAVYGLAVQFFRLSTKETQ